MDKFDDLLAGADPERSYQALTQKTLDAALIRARDISRDAAMTPSHRRSWRARAIVPAVLIGSFAVAGAAVSLPLLALAVNGNAVEYDAIVPIQYVTDSGIAVSCEVGYFIGDSENRSEADLRLAEFFATTDWSGVGQEIYDEAMDHPFIPGADDHLEVDNQDVRDSLSFSRALEVIYERVPSHLHAGVHMAGSATNCTGQLR